MLSVYYRKLDPIVSFQKPLAHRTSEIFHIPKNTANPHIGNFMIQALSTTDKVLRYGENNKVNFSEHPTVIRRSEKRIINIYTAVPNVA